MSIYGSAGVKFLFLSSLFSHTDSLQDECAAIVTSGEHFRFLECLDADALDEVYVMLWRICNFCTGIWGLRCREYRRDYASGFSEGGMYAQGGIYDAGDPRLRDDDFEEKCLELCCWVPGDYADMGTNAPAVPRATVARRV